MRNSVNAKGGCELSEDDTVGGREKRRAERDK